MAADVKKCLCGRDANTTAGAKVHCVHCGSTNVYGKDSASLYTVSVVIARIFEYEVVENGPKGYGYVDKSVYNNVLAQSINRGFCDKGASDDFAYCFKGFHCRGCSGDFSTADTCGARRVFTRTLPTIAAKAADGKDRPHWAEIAMLRYGCAKAPAVMKLHSLIDTEYKWRTARPGMPLYDLFLKTECYDWYDNYIREQEALKQSAEQAKPIPIDAPDTFFETVDATPIDDLVASPASPHRDKS